MDHHVDVLLATVALQQADLVDAVRRVDEMTRGQQDAIASLAQQVVDMRSELTKADERRRRIEDAVASIADDMKEGFATLSSQLRSIVVRSSQPEVIEGSIPAITSALPTSSAISPTAQQTVTSIDGATDPVDGQYGSLGRPISENTRLLRALLLRPIVDDALRSRIDELGRSIASLEASLQNQRVHATIESGDYAGVACRLETAQRSLAALRVQQQMHVLQYQNRHAPDQPSLPAIRSSEGDCSSASSSRAGLGADSQDADVLPPRCLSLCINSGAAGDPLSQKTVFSPSDALREIQTCTVDKSDCSCIFEASDPAGERMMMNQQDGVAMEAPSPGATQRSLNNFGGQDVETVEQVNVQTSLSGRVDPPCSAQCMQASPLTSTGDTRSIPHQEAVSPPLPWPMNTHSAAYIDVRSAAGIDFASSSISDVATSESGS